MAVIKQPTEEQIREKYDELALRLGNVVIAWNQLYDSLGGVFALVISMPHASILLDIWHSLKADRAQREMLEAAVKAVFKKKNVTRKRILWLTGKVSDLEPMRNNLIHSPYIAAEGGDLRMKPNTQSGNQKATQLVKKFTKRRVTEPLKGECELLEERIDTLTRLAREIARHLQHGKFPMPREPVWPCESQPQESRR